MRKIGNLAGPGATGNNTHASVPVDDKEGDLVVEFEVEAVGATPTVTYVVQGSMDDPAIPDASSDWVPIFGLKSNSATPAAVGGTLTAVGLESWQVSFPYEKVRLVTSANTNVTYNGEAYQ